MRWILKEKEKDGQEDPDCPEPFPRLIRRLLKIRGVSTPAEASRYLEPSLDDLQDPFLLPDMEAAVDRLDRAIARDEPIFLFGDYDVDGITSAAVLSRYLTRLGAKVRARVPERREGYGLSLRAVEEAHAWGAGLMVTADCGTQALQEIVRAAELGIDVIVVDHHQPGREFPPAVALVNPHRGDAEYPLLELAAVGIVTKMLEGLWRRLRRRDPEIPSPFSLLDLTALGTIADSVPLTGENRILVHHGIRLMRSSPRPSVRALIEVSRKDGPRLSATDVAFHLAPRLNAAGRLGDAASTLALLLCDGPEEAYRLASLLDSYNEERKRLLDSVVSGANELAEREGAAARGRPVVLAARSWHHGVLGIAAARVAERFGVPAILLTEEGTVLRGSGRTAGGCDLLALVRASCDSSWCAFGGHEAAVGLTLPVDHFAEFRERINDAAASGLVPSEPVERALTVDARARLDEVDPVLMGWLERMGPFGQGNQEPVLAIRGRLQGPARILKDRHLRFTLQDGNARRDCIGFHLAESAPWIGEYKGEILVAASVVQNSFRGEERIELQVKDLSRDDPLRDN